MAGSLRPEQLRTVQLVPLTAYDAAGELHLDPMRKLTERLLEAGVSAIIPCAGSAEFHSLTADEIITSIRMTREVAGDRMTIIAPIGLAPHFALDLGKRSLEAGADALLVMPLSFPYVSNEGARDYYLELLDKLAAPTMLYKKGEIPSHALLLELAEHPNLWGVKYAVNDIDGFNQVIHDDGGRIDWFCGNAERFAPFFMLAGAAGYTSGAGNICPRVTLAMHAACAAGNWTEALRLQQVLRPIEDFRARAGNSFNISFLKHAIQHTGLDFGPARAPNRRLTATECREIDELMPALLAAESELAGAAAAG